MVSEELTTIQCDDEVKYNIEVPFDDDCSSYCDVIDRYKAQIDDLVESLKCLQETIDELTRENLAYRTALDRWGERYNSGY